ncbi:MAG: hypothetical protein IKT58_05770 [Oscillospiraceae bacterium]|nr:hypothetical protein [Oscillospiraceae bacterium]
MYCVKCGVKLEDTEARCPLCNTLVSHPELKQAPAEALYPKDKKPTPVSARKAICRVILVLFIIPLIAGFSSDLQANGKLDWFGYVAGALFLVYVIFALPLWFRKANPVIFMPCSFVALGLYLLYINYASGGSWYLHFALPITGGLCLIFCAVTTLLYYVRGGRLYIFGGAFVTFGAYLLLLEHLLVVTFDIRFIRWSMYPFIILALLGCFLIYLAIDSQAREFMERKFFF